MRRSHSVSETSVGLFAFLDVLMSTMGSLILVLMIVSPKIRQEKIAKAATEVARDVVKVEPAPKPLPVVAPPRETIDLNAKFATRVAELSSRADDKRRTAAGVQRSLSTEREQAQKIRADREQLEREVAELRAATDRTLASVQDVSAEGLKVESELAKRGSRLRKIRDHIAHESTEYAFVAYDGVSGTTRRPILIECTGDRIKFLQEDITLTSADISGFTTAANPLRSGAEALLDYWSTHSGPNDPKPYVLMVVRPSGTLAYYRARNLLEQTKAPFGYELLPEDQKLAVPTPDAQAVAACRQAVAQAVAKRDSVFDQVFAGGSGLNPRTPWRTGAGGSRADLPGAGSGTAGQPNSPFDDPFGVAWNGTKGAAKGSGGDSLLAAGNATAGSAVPGGVGSGSAGVGGPGSAGGGSSGSAGAGPEGAGAAGGSKSPSTNDGNGPSKNAADPSGSGAEKSGGSLAASPGAGTLAGGTTEAGSGAQAGAGRSESGIELMPPPGAGRGAGSEAGTVGSIGTDPSAGELGASGGGTGLPPAGPPQMGPASSGLGSSPLTPIVQAGSGTSQPGSGQDGFGSGGAGQSEAAAETSGQPGSPQVASETGSAGAQGESSLPGGSPSGANAGSDPGGEPGQSSAGSADESGASPMPNFGQASDDGAPRSGAKRRWGYSSSQASIGFEHDVTIWIGARAIVVGAQPPISINRAESSQRLAALVTPALDREARTWGRPPDHLYWVPNLKFVVSPGGNLPYERLRPVLARHGLVSSVEYRLEMDSPRQTFQSWVQ